MAVIKAIVYMHTHVRAHTRTHTASVFSTTAYIPLTFRSIAVFTLLSISLNKENTRNHHPVSSSTREVVLNGVNKAMRREEAPCAGFGMKVRQ